MYELNLQDELSFRVGALNNSVPWRMECIVESYM